MNVLLSKNLGISLNIAEKFGWDLFRRSNASFLTKDNEQILNVRNHFDLYGLTVEKIYIHESFFSSPDFMETLMQLQARYCDDDLFEKLRLNKEFQVIEKTIYLNKWQN